MSKDLEVTDYLEAVYLNQFNVIISCAILIAGGMLGLFLPVLFLWGAGEVVVGYRALCSDEFRQQVKEAHAMRSFEDQQQQLISRLDPSTRNSYHQVVGVYHRIQDTMSASGGSESLVAWNSEIEKIKMVKLSYLRLALHRSRLRDLVSTTDIEHIKDKLSHVKSQLTPGTSVYDDQKKLAVTLQKRLSKIESAKVMISRLDLQLDLIEEQMQLIQEQVALAKNPGEQSTQLDVLVAGIHNLEQSELGLLVTNTDLDDEIGLLAP